MSILVKGMKMPEKCHLCPFWTDVNCTATFQNHGKKDCPLVPVPPHGRLIDADAFEDFIKKDWGKNDHWIAEVVYSRPTIIEADFDEDINVRSNAKERE